MSDCGTETSILKMMLIQAVSELQLAAWSELLPLPRPTRRDPEHRHVSLLWPELHEEQAADEPCLSHEAAKWQINDNVMFQRNLKSLNKQLKNSYCRH